MFSERDRDLGALNQRIKQPAVKPLKLLGKIAPILLGAAIVTGVQALQVKNDLAVNGDIVQSLRENWSWDRLFTTRHGITVAAQDHPWPVYGFCAAYGALLGVAFNVQLSQDKNRRT